MEHKYDMTVGLEGSLPELTKDGIAKEEKPDLNKQYILA